MFPNAYMPAAVANGCFDLLLLIHLLSKQAEENQPGPAFGIPPEWCTTRPTYQDVIGQGLNTVPVSDRFHINKEHFDNGMIQLIKGNRLTVVNHVQAEINIKHLHGPHYKDTAHNLKDIVSGVYDGGVLWELLESSGNSGDVLCNLHLAMAALKAARFNSKFLDLSFSGCGFSDTASHCAVLTELSKVCLSNVTLNSIVFPPRLNYKLFTHAYGSTTVNVLPALSPEEQQRYCAAWMAIGDALTRNPRPLFVSLSMADCLMGDNGLVGLLPGLTRLYQQLGLSPRALNFSGNGLSSTSVSYVCSMLTEAFNGFCVNLSWLQELSFGKNPWCNAPNVDAMCSVLCRATSLRVLDLSSSYGAFPTVPLKSALDQSMCPLRVLILGGYTVDPSFAVRCFCGSSEILFCSDITTLFDCCS